MRRIPHYKSRDRGPLNFASRIHREEGNVMSIARKPVITVYPTTRIKDAVETMIKNNVRRLPVVEPGTRKLVGVIRTRDVIDFLGGGEKHNIVRVKFGGNFFAAVNEPIKFIMSKDPIYGNSSMSMVDAVRLLLERGVGGLPILDQKGKVVGMVSDRDFISYIPSTTGAHVSYYMSRHVVTAAPTLRIMEAARTIIARNFRRIPVVSAGKLVGILTSVDILRYLGTGRIFEHMRSDRFEDAMSVAVQEIMTKDVISVVPETDIGEAAELMRKRGCGGLPVVSGEELVGIITERDLLRLLA